MSITIKGYPNYKVTSNGVIKNKKGKTLKQQMSNSGYYRVELWHRGYGKKLLVHRLVLQAFSENKNESLVANHIDGDKRNNNIENLEWVTRSENQKHAYRLGLQKGYRKSCPLSESHRKALAGSRWKKEKHVYKCDGKTFNKTIDAADYFNIARQTVLNRCRSIKWPNWKKGVVWLKN